MKRLLIASLLFLDYTIQSGRFRPLAFSASWQMAKVMLEVYGG